jgi:hypothetical protein
MIHMRDLSLALNVRWVTFLSTILCRLYGQMCPWFLYFEPREAVGVDDFLQPFSARFVLILRADWVSVWETYENDHCGIYFDTRGRGSLVGPI